MSDAQLYIDQGNTRSKFWLLLGDQVLQCGTVTGPDELHHQLSNHHFTEVVLATVKTAEEALALLQPWAAMSPIITTVKVCPDILATAYLDSSKLGIDRWLGVLAAKALGVGSALVVDAGTAITLDVLSEDGRHAGGYILPGLQMQQNALAEATVRVKFPQPDWRSQALGISTATAVGHGSVRAVCALVRDVAVEVKAKRIYLAGGNAQDLAPFMPEAQVVDDLLLAGMRAYVRALPLQSVKGVVP